MTAGEDVPLPLEGDVIAEKYRIERLVGEGAMGLVFRAHHLLLGHTVAIKLIRAAVETDDLRARFSREAKATMALRSDHVVRVFDLGILASTTPYMVLEYLEGTDLRALLDTHGALPVEEAVDYVLQACEGLAEAHLNGIVHRDLKPQNLFLTRRPNGTPCIKLLDFGVSKFEPRSGSKDELTMSHVMLGSPVYISPEQIRDSSKVDARADVWSLGVVLYMLLGGGRPFEGEGVGGTCAAIMVDAPRPLAARCPTVPSALEAVILRCLEKSRERRTPDVAELARSLEPFASAAGRVSIGRIVHLYATSPHRAERTPPPPPSTGRSEAGHDVFIPVDVENATAIEKTSIDPPPRFDASGRVAGIDTSAAAKKSRWLAPAAGAAMLVALLAASGLVWRRAHAQDLPARAAAAADPAGSLASPEQAPPPASEAPPKPDEPGPDLAGASVSPPPPGATQGAAPRRLVAGARPAPTPKATTTGSSKRKGQLDRNGVPILD